MIYDYNIVIFKQTRDPDLNLKILDKLKIKMAQGLKKKTCDKIEFEKKKTATPNLKSLNCTR